MSTKTKPKNERMFMKSIEFIKDNPDITTHKLPDRLLKYWIVPKFTKNMEYKISTIRFLFSCILSDLTRCLKRKSSVFLIRTALISCFSVFRSYSLQRNIAGEQM